MVHVVIFLNAAHLTVVLLIFNIGIARPDFRTDVPMLGQRIFITDADTGTNQCLCTLSSLRFQGRMLPYASTDVLFDSGTSTPADLPLCKASFLKKCKTVYILSQKPQRRTLKPHIYPKAISSISLVDYLLLLAISTIL